MLDGWSKIGLAGELSHRDNWCNSSRNYPQALSDLATRRERQGQIQVPFLIIFTITSGHHRAARWDGLDFAELATCLVSFQ